MKLVKTASGKNVLSIEKEEWAKIGIEKGWMISKAQTTPMVGSAPISSSVEPVWKCNGCNREVTPSDVAEHDGHCPNCDSLKIEKFQ